MLHRGDRGSKGIRVSPLPLFTVAARKPFATARAATAQNLKIEAKTKIRRQYKFVVTRAREPLIHTDKKDKKAGKQVRATDTTTSMNRKAPPAMK